MTVELLKLRSTRTVWILLGAAQLLIIGGISGLMLNGKNVDSPEVLRKAASHLGLVALFTLILGIMAVAGEYRHRTITDAYLAEPRRAKVILAKLAAYTVTGLGFGVVGMVTALVTTAIWLAAKGYTLDLSTVDMWSTLIGGVLWNGLFAAIGVGVGALITNLIGAVAAALAWLALVEGIVAQLVGGIKNWLPFALGSALDSLPTATGGPEPWLAGLALAAYAAAFAIAAVFTSTRRDVA